MCGRGGTAVPAAETPERALAPDGAPAPDRSPHELATQVIAQAAERGLRVAVAESLTGGALLSALVAVPGASRVILGGVVAYDTALKHSLLGVEQELLARRGPVDGTVAVQMARGVRRACALPVVGALESPEWDEPELGIATTGVAGPDPDPQTGQPAGTVWIGVSAGEHDTSFRLDTLRGDRSAIRTATVRAALEALLSAVNSA
ncbi:competence/damage-inducible protein cinA [Leucobacter luti]|nr:competence/damage-inducible protein cinA [Leucobacter luti]